MDKSTKQVFNWFGIFNVIAYFCASWVALDWNPLNWELFQTDYGRLMSLGVELLLFALSSRVVFGPPDSY